MPQNNNHLKLTVVIHTEEEFDWNGGFLRSNNQVTHGEELIKTIDVILSTGAKVVLAMDYAFVNSEQGQAVINNYLAKKNDVIEFAAHCHPWVNLPFETDSDEVENKYSYPGNLPKEIEYEKLKTLSDIIQLKTQTKPTTYLAGRYGIGENTAQTLVELGYKTDISISSFADFSHQEGPDFSHYNNTIFNKNGIKYWPHTTGIVSIMPWLSSWLNNNPRVYTDLIGHSLTRLIAKVLRIQRLRLSPEGFQIQHLKKLTKVLIKRGESEFIFSFHSSTTKVGGSPYVQNEQQQKQFVNTIEEYLTWYKNTLNGQFCLVNQTETL